MLANLHSRIPSRALGLARILVGFAAVIKAGQIWFLLMTLAEPATLLTPWFDWLPSSSPALAGALVVVWIAAALLFSIGWHVPVSGTTLLLTVAATVSLDQQLYGNHVYLLVWLVLLMLVADAGAGLTVGNRDRRVVRWPVLLIMFQLSLVYGFSALSKLNEDFLSGLVLAGVLRGGIIPFPDSLRTPSFLSVIAALAVMTELFIALFIWRARLRPAVFIVGLGFHVSLILLMAPTVELVVFALQMLALYPLFLGTDKLILVWDDECESCADWVARFRRIDLLHSLLPVGKREAGHDVPKEEVEKSLQLIHAGTTVSGFRAVTWTLEHLVPTLWVAPILRFPGVKTLGERWYRWQAARRSCAVGQPDSVRRSSTPYS